MRDHNRMKSAPRVTQARSPEPLLPWSAVPAHLTITLKLSVNILLPTVMRRVGYKSDREAEDISQIQQGTWHAAPLSKDGTNGSNQEDGPKNENLIQQDG